MLDRVVTIVANETEATRTDAHNQKVEMSSLRSDVKAASVHVR